MDRTEFIKEVARRSNSTQKDIKEIWEEVENLIYESVENRVDLEIRGLFSIHYGMVGARKGFKPQKGVKGKGAGEVMEYPECERLIMKPGRNLTDILRPDEQKKCFTKQERDEARNKIKYEDYDDEDEFDDEEN
jgi:nucleoid DNA-binding protein